MAGADPEVRGTLVLTLEHKQLPGMIKQGNKFLKAFKPLPFDNIKIVSAETGEVLLDIPDPEDLETEQPATPTATPTATPSQASATPPTSSQDAPQQSDLLTRLSALANRIKEFAAAADAAGQKVGADLEAKKAALEPKNRLVTLVRDFKAMVGKNEEQAEAMLQDIENILNGGVPASPQSTVENPGALFNERLKALVPRIKSASGTPAGDQAKLKASEAGVFARNREFDQANVLLDEAEQLLEASTSSQSASPNVAEPTENKSRIAPGIAFTQSRLAWDSTRKAVQSELQSLESAILEACASHNNDPNREFDVDLKTMAEQTKTLYSMLNVLDTSLIDTLDKALNAGDDTTRKMHQDEASKIIKNYRNYVDSDPLLLEIDDNGFTSTKIRSKLVDVLDDLASKL